MRRVGSCAWFLLGLAVGIWIGSFTMAPYIPVEDGDRLREREILWALVEIQGRTIGKCDQILYRLGLREISHRKP